MIKKLDLVNFRNYEKHGFEFGKTTLIVGPNASGKTNILEAIYALAIGKSFRADRETEVIKEAVGDRVARVAGTVGDTELEIIWDGRLGLRKLYKVNGVGKRQVDFVGNFWAVLFSPLDLAIVINSPATRRRYLDSVLTPVHKDYRVSLMVYEKALRQRNRLIWKIRESRISSYGSRAQMEYWDKLLITNGKVIHDRRKDYLAFLSTIHDSIFKIQLVYDHSIVSDERLARYGNEEIAAAATLVGPHRDDFTIYHQLPSRNQELSHYGSRGEQRLATFALKLGELEYIQSVTGERPVLLLDDIFSELDAVNRRHILKVVPEQQTIITTTDIHTSEEKFLAKLGAGRIGLGGS